MIGEVPMESSIGAIMGGETGGVLIDMIEAGKSVLEGRRMRVAGAAGAGDAREEERCRGAEGEAVGFMTGSGISMISLWPSSGSWDSGTADASWMRTSFRTSLYRLSRMTAG